MRFLQLGILLIGVVFWSIPAQAFDMLAFLKEGLKVCSRIEDSSTRLGCYDELAATQEEDKRVGEETLQAEKYGAWSVYRAKDEMDDKEIILVENISPLKGEGVYQENNHVLRVMAKKGSGSFLSIKFAGFIGEQYNIKIEYRLDNEPAKTSAGWRSKDNGITLDNPRKFVKRMLGHDMLKVFVTSYDGEPFIAKFDLSGIEKAMKPIFETTGWK